MLLGLKLSRPIFNPNSAEVTDACTVLSDLLYADQIWSLDLISDSTELQIKS